MPEDPPLPPPLSKPALEEYCLLKYSDRFKYKKYDQIKTDLIKSFEKAEPSNLELSVFSEFFNRILNNPLEIQFAEDDLYGYAYRKNGSKKLISVFYISNFKKKDMPSRAII